MQHSPPPPSPTTEVAPMLLHTGILWLDAAQSLDACNGIHTLAEAYLWAWRQGNAAMLRAWCAGWMN